MASCVGSMRLLHLGEGLLEKQILSDDKKSLPHLVAYVQKPILNDREKAGETFKFVTKSVSNAATIAGSQVQINQQQESGRVDARPELNSPLELLERRQNETAIHQAEREENSTKDKIAVERVLQGDVSAFQELVERYEKRVYRIAFAVLGNTEDAKDVSQEAFIRVYQRLEGFRGESSFYTWLYRIAFNLAVDLSRKRYRSKELAFSEKEDKKFPTSGLRLEGVSDSSFSATVETPNEAYERVELGRRLDAAMESLSEEHRAVIAMRELDGLSYSEIADAVGISKGTVMSRLHHARKKLQQFLLRSGEKV
jgi:RNA polymerase sigma-70 factor (ECF subfamily)